MRWPEQYLPRAATHDASAERRPRRVAASWLAAEATAIEKAIEQCELKQVRRDRKKRLDDRFTRDMTETVEGMRAAGIMDAEAPRLTMRDLNRAPPAKTVTP